MPVRHCGADVVGERDVVDPVCKVDGSHEYLFRVPSDKNPLGIKVNFIDYEEKSTIYAIVAKKGIAYGWLSFYEVFGFSLSLEATFVTPKPLIVLFRARRLFLF